MTQEEIRELFIQGIDCSQVVTGRLQTGWEWKKTTQGRCPPALEEG